MNDYGLSFERLKDYSDSFNGSAAARVAANASVKNGFLKAATDYKGISALPYSFSVDLKQGSITNQQHSGRCWLFSALNTFRFEIIKRWNLEDFELSQNYLFFWDKIERSNYFLESVLSTKYEPVDGRLYSFLNSVPIGDGGQWDMMANLVRKYGVVPKAAYQDSANSINSGVFNQYVTSLLREDAISLRRLAAGGAGTDSLRAAKADMLRDIYRMLCIALGEPPVTFDVTMTDKEGKVYQEFGTDGREFFRKYVGLNIDDYVSLVNAPTDDKPMERTYTVKYLGNVVDGREVRYLNLPLERFKEAVARQLKDGHPVWFGCDCSKFALREEGIYDRAAANVEQLCGISLHFSKGERLMYGESSMNHAMVFLGVNLDENGRPDRWRIENSWGKEAGANGGYFIASDAWFDEFVYQVAVRKQYLEENDRRLLGLEPIRLEPWDPLGALAD